MDTSFAFPRHQAPPPRPAPPSGSSTSPTSGSTSSNRDSNALRASVLDAALQLGIGTNSTVANWMFNNALPEEAEENQSSPALTYGSSATSEESSFSARFASPSSSHTPSNPKSAHNLAPVPEGHIHFDPSIDIPVRPPTRTGTGEPQGFPDIPEIPVPPPRPVTPVRGKLRKKRGDGYESDGGYMSDVGKKKKDKDKKKSGGVKDGTETVHAETEKEAKKRAKEEKLQEKREKEEERKRKKSMSKAAKKGQVEDKDGYTTGYETDGTPAKGIKSSKKPSKSKAVGDAGYETDSGYLSSTSTKSKKSRFFRLGSKQSKQDQEEVPAMPTAVIPMEPVPLPIALKFATTLGPPPASATASSNNISPTSTDPELQNLSMTSPAVTASSAPTPTAADSPTSPTAVTSNTRESFGSVESGASASASSSASHKRRGIQFFAQDSAHGQGSGSYSTINSASRVPLPPSAATSPTSPSSKTRPPISLPLTHTTSLSPSLGAYPSTTITPTGSSSKPPSPSSTVISPSTLSSPTVPTSRNPSPVPRTQFLQATTPSPSPNPSGTSSPQPRPRPRFPPTDGFSPRLTPKPSPSPSVRSPSPFLRSPSRQGQREGRPDLTIIPSTSFIVPSPRASPGPGLPSPNKNVFAYYDIPPPSPPPAGPLPSVPHARQDHGSSSIARSRTPEQDLFAQPIPSIQRGREPPFPARPVLPSGAAPGSSSSGSGLEARVKVPRYRELYGLALPLPKGRDHRASWRDAHEHAQDENEEVEVAVVEPSEAGNGWEDVGYDRDEEYDEEADADEEEMRDVLERFEEARVSGGGERRRQGGAGRALGRNQSSEALRSRLHADRGGNGDASDSDYHDRYSDEAEEEDVRRKLSTSTEMEEGGGDRNSRWSGSIYSRVSVLDPEESEEARQRFVKRVEAMYGDGGREKSDVVPPVPKIPDAFVGGAVPAPGRSWIRF
ncbi:hypothetical protein LshimejAT787_1202630 [Lyophyllum shimeji]|uniref:Uncharacterized protein n=1 Tax=Lyophyllum shimeji TaxID=47721 RepID=A0A9P3PWE4_LYOSH|nr:hypothetical protein LshimejAT787_1202630 [Lyophyllum shimeji]